MATSSKSQVHQPLMTFVSLIPTTSTPYNPNKVADQPRPLPERRDSLGYLTLAPATSTSYPRPRQQSVSHLHRPLPLTHGSDNMVPTLSSIVSSSAISSVILPEHSKSRRSSSMSSDVSTSSRGARRFLKLGPVHWGEHLGDHKEDWAEVEEDEISPISK